MSNEKFLLDEIAARCKRIETRLTGYLEDLGYATKTVKPAWDGRCIQLPSLMASFKDVHDALPEGLASGQIFHHGKLVGVMVR